ncbi:MAG: polymorphic toxin-type HINT domain-containing protein [Chloroflexota bacterium]
MSIPGLPAGARHLLADGLGSTLGLLDPSATPTTAYTYEPFGRTTSTGAFSANSARFTGREDDGTGLAYYRARYYSPQLQRFISEDPIGFAGGDANLHAYVGNDPVNLTDPSGENPLLAACAGGAALDALVYVALNGRKTTASGVAGAAASGCVGGIVGLGIGRLAGAVLPRVMGAISRSRIANTCKFNSFSADTDVATEQGPRRIDSIRVGDRVLAYDEETGETASQLVTATWGHQDPVVVQVTVGDEQLVATPDHPFSVVGRGWVKASDLRPGDRISRAFGGTGPVIEVTVARQPQVMYNLTVDTAHTYFVGDDQALVHNDCASIGARVGVWVHNRSRNINAYKIVINRLGELFGCHTCGRTTSGLPGWIMDHFPPWSFNWPPYLIRPQCRWCSEASSNAGKVIKERIERAVSSGASREEVQAIVDSFPDKSLWSR